MREKEGKGYREGEKTINANSITKRVTIRGWLWCGVAVVWLSYHTALQKRGKKEEEEGEGEIEIKIGSLNLKIPWS